MGEIALASVVPAGCQLVAGLDLRPGAGQCLYLYPDLALAAPGPSSLPALGRRLSCLLPQSRAVQRSALLGFCGRRTSVSQLRLDGASLSTAPDTLPLPLPMSPNNLLRTMIPIDFSWAIAHYDVINYSTPYSAVCLMLLLLRRTSTCAQDSMGTDRPTTSTSN